MADKNLAQMIYNIAKEDKNFHGLQLQELYKKKIQLDIDNQRDTLKKVVEKFIMNNYQAGDETKITLDDDMVTGGTAIYNPTDEDVNNIFVSDDDYSTKNLKVTNLKSQNLIEHAIIPLGLKWRLKRIDKFQVALIKISWDHWDT